MSWNYFLVYTDTFLDYDAVKYWLNAREDVASWLHIADNFFLLKSENAARSLGDALIEYARKNKGVPSPKYPPGRIFISEVPSDTGGLLPKAAWAFLKPPPDENDDEIPF